ncbi:MAG: Protein translocase subunit SecD, partial [Frankiales bacterium]|nr:Protein translocase subunit SecD [Frankiales bacterium]
MARPGPSNRGQLHTWRYLGVLAGIFAILYTTMAFAGSHGVLKPKLGLDLKGGAQVILTPKSENGKHATADQLATAVEILRLRVNGAGVSEAEVLLQGQQIVVQVPGGNRDSIKSVTKAAQLQFRKVLECANLQASGGCSQLPLEQIPKALLGTPAPSASATATPAPSASVIIGTPKPTASPVKRPVSAGLLAATPTPTATPKPSAAPRATATPTPSATSTPSADAAPAVLSGAVYTPQAFADLNCSDPAALAGGAPANPSKPVVACSKDGTEKFHLDVAKVVGKDVKSANVGTDQLGTQVLVNLNFKGGGQDRWTNLTIEACGSNNAATGQCPAAGTPSNRVAVVLDGVVYSSPSINEPINGPAQISGQFTQKEAQDLVNVLKFGALPLTFVAGDTEVISASLGDDQLRSGLLAGGLGLLAVVIYSLIYYRALGLVTIASLLVSGGLVYASICILGDLVGFALSLAGIAGFIVAVGITADSFIVYFERLKDEIKEGRTPRSAVDRAWVRARRTILSADTVSFLAALILYIFSVGGVRGFAF